MSAEFDRRAGTYESGWRAEFHARVIDAAVRCVVERAAPERALLDVGCGTGALLRGLEERLGGDVRLEGVDPAPAMIEVASGRASRIRFRVAAAETLPFADGSFDVVASTVSFHHWSDHARGLAEIARVLEPGGRLFLADHFATGWLRAFDALARRHMWSVGRFETLLAAAGLRPMAWTRVYDLGPLPLIRGSLAVRG